MKSDDEVTPVLMSVCSYCFFLAECCNSYLGKIDLRGEKRINKILAEGSLFLVFPGRSRTRTIL